MVEMERVVGEPVRWGRDDCATFVANVLRPVLGYDPAAEFRGRYETREGYEQLLGAAGLVFRLDGLAQRFGWKRISPELALVGDVGFARLADKAGKKQVTAAICRAPGWFVARSDSGIAAIADRHIRCVNAVV